MYIVNDNNHSLWKDIALIIILPNKIMLLLLRHKQTVGWVDVTLESCRLTRSRHVTLLWLLSTPGDERAVRTCTSMIGFLLKRTEEEVFYCWCIQDCLIELPDMNVSKLTYLKIGRSIFCKIVYLSYPTREIMILYECWEKSN